MTQERMRMALFDALITPGTVYGRIPQNDHVVVERDHEHTKELLAAHRVWVDETLHQRLDAGPATVDFRKDFGLLRLPYPNLWLEWYDSRYDLHVGLHCMEAPVNPRHSTDWSNTCEDPDEHTHADVHWLGFPYLWYPHGQTPDGHPMPGLNQPTMYNHVLRLDFEGLELLGATHLLWRGKELAPTFEDPNYQKDLGTIVDTVWNALVAIGFMNCKNVTTERIERPAHKASKKSRRLRPARSDYHVIVLPKAAYAGDSYSTGAHGEKRLHCVRGHTKTFTPERPLFGRYTGTYWWADTLRGNPDLGVIEADYKVAN